MQFGDLKLTLINGGNFRLDAIQAARGGLLRGHR